MKKIVFLCVLCTYVLTVNAVEINGINYSLNDETMTASVIAKTPQYSGSVNIPSSVTYDKETYSVTSIRYTAFNRCANLTSVTIPQGVKKIESSTFLGCTKLNSIHISESVTDIGDNAFHKCISLTSISLPSGLESIGNWAFDSCINLQTITLPSKITKISSALFYNCHNLSSITFRGNINYIGSAAFLGCYSLSSFTIPNGVTSIETSTFFNCINLQSVTIPSSVITIGDVAFAGCNNLLYIDLPSTITTIGERAFLACSSLESIRLPAGLSSIGASAFAYSGLTSITIPEGITVINDYLFYDCQRLKTAHLPSSVSSIGYAAFYNCSSLTNFPITESLTSMGEFAFGKCSMAETLVIPESITTIPAAAFAYCSNLKTLTIGSNVKKIEDSAFAECISLTAIYNNAIIPQSINSNVLQGVNRLLCLLYVPKQSITLYKEAEVWREFFIIEEGECIGGFGKCGDNLAWILSCDSTKLLLSGSGEMTDYAQSPWFKTRYLLKAINITEGLTKIGEYAFAELTSVKSVTIPNSVTRIEKRAFYNCKALQTIICHAANPPICGASAFGKVNKQIPLYVPEASIEAYKVADQWKEFMYILPIEAKPVSIFDITVSTSSTTLNVSWPKDGEAYQYELTIRNADGNVVCTYIFDSEGRLVSTMFGEQDRGKMLRQTQNTGFTFTITGLDSGTNYKITITAMDDEGHELTSETISFSTEDEPFSIRELLTSQEEYPMSYCRKIIRNGQLFIQRGNELFNAQGARVE